MNAAASNNIYTDGSYLDMTGGTWGLEDSAFKAREIAKMLARHPEFKFNTICDIGCGAGGVLAELQRILPSETAFTGFEISPQAHSMSERFENARCQYVLGDAFGDSEVYDLVLVLDVVEHVEDCFSFLRRVRLKGRMKLYHIPLEVHVSSIIRGVHSWDTVGHLHRFTIETALRLLEHTGHCVVDYIFTDVALGGVHKTIRTHLANLVRLPLSKVSAKFAARLLGGYSMLILAE